MENCREDNQILFSASQYKYSPLQNTTKDIRILTLLPRSASISDTIHIQINIAKLEEASQLDYEALSYVWGTEENPATIYVGEAWEHFLKVTRNLAEALVHLRYENDIRVLWIDAICIDQQNLQERSQQILKMVDIYRMAPRATVWLGPGNAQCKMAMTLLTHLSNKLDIDWYRAIMTPSQDTKDSGDEAWADRHILLPYSKEEAGALFSLLSRPWFKRLWIRQEIWLSGSKAVLTCGNDTMLWVDFRKSIFCLRIKILNIHEDQRQKYAELISYIYDLCDSDGYRTLKGLVSASRHADCSDPRDRVYGTLNLMSTTGLDLQPDYTKTASQVYKDLVLGSIDQLSDLGILKCCHLDDRDPDMPSWVPDLTRRSTDNIQPEYHASGDSSCYAGAVDERTLKVTGRRVSTVKQAYWTPSKDAATYLDVISIVRKLVPSHLNEIYVGGGTIFDAYCRTLARNFFSDASVPSNNSWLDFAASKIALARILDGPQSTTSLSSNEDFYSNVILNVMSNSKFITTGDGYMGIAPPAAQAGDEVCLLLGLNSLILLRPYPSQEDRYEVVGGAYVHGLMDTEGLLGPLPKPYRAVRRFDNIGKYLVDGYLNQETEEWTPDDPRLGELPEGWIKRKHSEDEYLNKFMNEETGEDRGVHDPRLTVEQLTRRGVELKDFYLV